MTFAARMHQVPSIPMHGAMISFG